MITLDDLDTLRRQQQILGQNPDGPFEAPKESDVTRVREREPTMPEFLSAQELAKQRAARKQALREQDLEGGEYPPPPPSDQQYSQGSNQNGEQNYPPQQEYPHDQNQSPPDEQYPHDANQNGEQDYPPQEQQYPQEPSYDPNQPYEAQNPGQNTENPLQEYPPQDESPWQASETEPPQQQEPLPDETAAWPQEQQPTEFELPPDREYGYPNEPAPPTPYDLEADPEMAAKMEIFNAGDEPAKPKPTGGKMKVKDMDVKDIVLPPILPEFEDIFHAILGTVHIIFGFTIFCLGICMFIFKSVYARTAAGLLCGAQEIATGAMGYVAAKTEMRKYIRILYLMNMAAFVGGVIVTIVGAFSVNVDGMYGSYAELTDEFMNRITVDTIFLGMGMAETILAFGLVYSITSLLWDDVMIRIMGKGYIKKQWEEEEEKRDHDQRVKQRKFKKTKEEWLTKYLTMQQRIDELKMRDGDIDEGKDIDALLKN